MLSADLINSCRVCRSPNQDGDYESLYNFSSKHKEKPDLSEAGILYENLLNISLNAWHYYPQFLCKSCDLQMKLFKKLKDKAYKTLEYLKSIYDEEVNKPMDIQQSSLDEHNDFVSAEYQENEFEYYQDDGIEAYHENNVNEFEGYPSDDPQSVTPNENEDNTVQYEGKLADECKEEPLTTINTYREEQIQLECLYYTEGEESSIMTTNIGNNIEPENGINNKFMENQFELKLESMEEKLKISSNYNENISQLSVNLEPLIDKNDYITEIYELLDDESTCSENNNYEEFDIIEDDNAEENSVFSDIDYIIEEEIYSPDENDQENQNVKTRCNNKRNVPSSRKREYKCKACQLEFRNFKEHKLHRNQVHHEKFICKVCFKEFKSSETLDHHMKLHRGLPAYQCEICQKTFKQKAHFQYHMNRHNNVRNFKCELCEKAFISKTDLKVHMRFHSGQRPYVCNICGKDYLMMEHLKTHLLRHTEQYFECEVCNHKFTTHKTLRLHVRTIHEDDPKFKCNFCLKLFRRKHHLEYHMKMHQKNVTYLDSRYEAVDDPCINNEADYNPDYLDEQVSIEDPGFIALNDDIKNFSFYSEK